jgi:hypothetical protein
MKNRLFWLARAFLLPAVLACLFRGLPAKAQQQDVPEPLFMNFSIQPPYITSYHGRDPFKPLDNVDRQPQISIAELDYHGLISVGDTLMALFTWRGNSSVRYTLKYRKLFSGGEKMIDGVIGDITDSSVILTQGDQKIVYPRKQ